jgi:hypothetical protein
MLKRFTSHTLMALAEAGLIAILVVGLIAGTAFAGRGGKGGGGGKPTGGSAYSGTIWLAPLVVDSNGNGLPNRGDVVTFGLSTSNTAPFVQLDCYQGGTQVLMGRKGFFEGSLDTNWNFGLTSGAWESGSVDCTGSLVYYTGRYWAKYASKPSFHVDW